MPAYLQTQDGLVVLWDYSPGVIDMRGILLGHETDVWGVDLNEKYIVSCSGDGSVMVRILLPM